MAASSSVVSAWSGPGREVGHVGADLAERRRPFVRRQGQVERTAGEALEWCQVFVGHPEQLADHQ
jgi:hypothetical protein